MLFSFLDSLRLNNLFSIFNKQSKVYPTLANGITVTTGATSWLLGNFSEIVPVNTLTNPYKIDYISFAAFSVASTYEVVLYKGLSGSEIEIGRIRVNPGATTNAVMALPIYTKTLNANERLSVKIASGSTGSNTLITSIVYHDYTE